MNYDVFNGDADGIISLLQLRLHEPRPAQLITGIKRDISLVKNIPLETLTADSLVTILDISLRKNRDALNAVLNRGAEVLYIDHHKPGPIPNTPNLTTHIEQSARKCTALIIDELLDGKFHHWAITAAYGDNLTQVANELASDAGLSKQQKELLEQLGTLINYNGYGANTDELAYHPAVLFELLLSYNCPFECIADADSPYHRLKHLYEEDYRRASKAEVLHQSPSCYCLLLENNGPSRRISGSYGNELANEFPTRAHIILTTLDEEHYLVSLRAPRNRKKGAGDICAQFETGGGRAAAGGINKLPKARVYELIDAVERYYSEVVLKNDTTR